MENYAITHKGLREENQDRFLIQEFEDQTIHLAVADGMGGEVGGELAAQIAIDTVKGFILSDLTDPTASLKKLFRTASRRIAEEVLRNQNLEGMGTTLTTAYLKNEIAHWVHVGDSRLYLFRNGRLTQITEDHTFVNSLVKEGVLTKAEAEIHPMQNILLRCVGCEPLKMSSGHFRILKNDCLLLCTDGLYHEVSGEKMVSILNKKINIKEKFESLIQTALDAGGRDNITIVGVEI